MVLGCPFGQDDVQIKIRFWTRVLFHNVKTFTHFWLQQGTKTILKEEYIHEQIYIDKCDEKLLSSNITIFNIKLTI